ncbi:MAG: outer membrane beta-barrel protein [Pyrinomonadaceae bacterium]
MRKLLFLAILIACCAPLTFAQDEYHKIEVSGGYSHARVDTGIDDQDIDDSDFGGEFGDFLRERRGYNGFDVSAVGNVHKYVGLKVNFSGHFKSDDFTITDGGTTIGLNSKERLYNFLGGVQLKDNRKESRVKPFGHVMAGVARQTLQLSAPGLTVDSFDLNDNSFAMKVGGGLDLRVHPRVDLRLIEINYNPVFHGDENFMGQTFRGSTQHNLTFGFGVAIH